MSSTTVFNAIGDFFYWTFQILEADKGFTAFFNYFLLFVGFFGMLYWLNLQRKFNQEAANDPNKLK